MKHTLQLYRTTRAHKPTITITPASDTVELLDEMGRALCAPPRVVFRRAGRLVRVRTDGERAQVEELEESGAAALLVERVRFVRLGERATSRVVPPPRELVRMLLSSDVPVPELHWVVHHPIVRPDGSICCREGWDPQTGFWVHLGEPVVPPVPNRPGQEDVARALEILEDILCDFPFEDQSSRANTLAMFLTPLLRTAFGGPTPLFLIDKPSPGTGATLLARLISTVTSGEDEITSPPEDEGESRKMITATLLGSREIVILDDVPGIRLRTFARLLTSTTWQDRLLGTNRMTRLPNLSTWIATGNNVSLGADLGRRAVYIRLDSRHYRPWERTDFRHPNLLEHAREHRGQVLWALLTLARAWYAAGCPATDVPVMGGFEKWARTVGGVLACAGISGFLLNRERLYEEVDQQHAGWPEFLRALHEHLKCCNKDTFTARWLERELRENKEQNKELRDALPEGIEDPTARTLAEQLRRRKGIRFSPDGLRVERADRGREGVLWRVVTDPPRQKSVQEQVVTDPPPREDSEQQVVTDPPPPDDYEALEREAIRSEDPHADL